MLCKFFLKLARDDVSFPSAEKSFQALAPLKEKHFWPVFEFFLGSLKSVSVLTTKVIHETTVEEWGGRAPCVPRSLNIVVHVRRV